MSGPNGEKCEHCYWAEPGEKEDGIWCHHNALGSNEEIRPTWWCNEFRRRDTAPVLLPEQCEGCRAAESFILTVDSELWGSYGTSLLSLPDATPEQRQHINRILDRYRELKKHLNVRQVDVGLSTAVGLLARWLSIYPSIAGDLGKTTREFVRRYDGEEEDEG